MDLSRPELVAALMFMTLLAVLAWGVWQNFSVRRSQRRSGVDPDTNAPLPGAPGREERARRAGR